jgi:predicted porin
MKKSLLLVSLLAAFGTASAASSVTLYGVVDASIGQTETTNVSKTGLKTTTKNSNLVREGRNYGLSGSRFGIKGVEDLPYGLKGHFVIEQALNVRTGELAQGISGGESGSGRQTYVGLSGDFGALTLGRQYTPFYEAIEPLTNVDAGGAFTLSSKGTIDNTVRANSSIKYTSPVFSGVKVSLLGASDTTNKVTVGTSVTGDEKTDTMGASISYTYDKLTAALGYNGIEKKSASITTMKTETSAAGLSYDFGVAKMIASYTEQKDTGAGFTGNIKTKDTTVGVKVPFGAAYVMASVGQNDMKDTRSTRDVSKASSKGTNAVLGAGYNLSKRTEAYVRYAKMNEAKYKTAAGVANGSTKTEAFGVGVRHTF